VDIFGIDENDSLQMLEDESVEENTLQTYGLLKALK
jgi:hypothetical protein